jgi:nitroreductase
MFMDLLKRRRSVRKFQDRRVERENIDRLREAVLRSPSSRGFNPWEFVFVTDPGTLARLSTAKPHGASFLKNAPLAVVVLADPSKSDVWVEDASIATLILHLAATDLGLGSCWIQIRERPHDETTTAEAYIAGLLGIPEGQKVLAMVAIGHPAEEKEAHPADSLQYDKIRLNRYGQGE